jgi:glycosyltransferase involved in cell wall biosynthesis
MDKLSQPLVSIVFTSYNHCEYLRQALDSLLNQTYPNTEIIIIDDCSTDGSQEILREYEHFENINLKLQTQNSGSYVKASNLGASFAKGEYLLFAQCDDFAEPNQIELLVEASLNNPTVGVVFSKSNLVDNKGVRLSDDYECRDNKFKIAVNRNNFIFGDEMRSFLSVSCVIPNLSAALVSHKLFIKVNGLSEKYLMASDWSFWLELSELTDFYYINSPLNNFRQHNTTIRSQTKINKQLIEIFNVFQSHISKYKLVGKSKGKLLTGFGYVWFNYFLETPLKVFLSFFNLIIKISKTNRLMIYYIIIGSLNRFFSVVNKKFN